MRRRLLRIAGFLLLPSVLGAQRPSETFEVTSVKPQTRLLGGASRTGTRYYEPGTTLRRVIEFAYDLPPVRVAGGPPWIGSDLWEIEARSLAPATTDEMRVMVRALLAERFELRTRVESRELPVYDLHAARPDGRLGPNATAPEKCAPIGSRSIESLREQLGLRVESTTALVDVLVIESVARPMPN